MAPHATATLAVLVLLVAITPRECNGGFFDLLSGSKKNETQPTVNATSTIPRKGTNAEDLEGIKPTIEVSVFPRGVPVSEIRENKRRPSHRRVMTTAATPVATVPPEAQVIFKAAQEPPPPSKPEQTVLKNFITTKDNNNNIVATIDVPAQDPIVTGGPSVSVRQMGESQPDNNPGGEVAFPEDENQQNQQYSPFTPDPYNPGVMYGPYPAELGYKPFGYLPFQGNHFNNGFMNEMEIGPHPWWHRYIRRRRTWYDYPPIPAHPWQYQPMHYSPLTNMWSRQRSARELIPPETEIFPEANAIPENYGMHPSYYPYHNSNPYFYNPYSYPYTSPFSYSNPYPNLYSNPYAYRHAPTWSQYPSHQPAYFGYGNPDAPPPEEPNVSYARKSSKSESQKTDETAEQPHIRHQKHRSIVPSWQLPQVQQPYPFPMVSHPYWPQVPLTEEQAPANIMQPEIQSPSSFPSPFGSPAVAIPPPIADEPPRPPPAPPAPSGGDISYEREE